MPAPGSASLRRRILGLAVPAIGTLIADPLLGAVDTAVAGRLGAAQLGALGLSVAILGAVTWVFNFLVYGTTASVARAIGAGDVDGAGARVAHAGVVALGLGVVAGAVLFGVAPAIVRGFGAVDSLVDPSVAYLRVRAVGIPFALLAYVGHGAFRGVQDTRTPLIVVGVANLLNGGLDLLLVYGFGFGLAGIAWATVGAEVAAVALFGVLLHRAGLPLAGHGLPTRARLRKLLTVSRDLFLRTGGLLAGILLVSAAASRIDETTAAAHQALWQVWMLLAFLLDGFAIAGQAMIGNALGAGDHQRARQEARALLRWGVGLGVVAAAVLLPLHGLIVRLFTSDGAVLAASATAWWLMAGGQLHNGIIFVLDGVLLGAEDYAYLRTWTAVAALTGGVVAQVMASSGAGLVGLWVGMELMLLLRLASLVLRVRGDGWLTAGDRLAAATAE